MLYSPPLIYLKIEKAITKFLLGEKRFFSPQELCSFWT